MSPIAPEADVQDVLREVRKIDIQTRRLVTGVMAGGYLSVFRGSGIEFETVREYAEGDPQRSVDWNVTARMGKPYVKTYVDERELTMLFLLDLSASMDGGFGVWSARETAARVAACLAFSAVRNGDKVGLIAFSERVDAYVRPKKGVNQALRVVRDCLALRASTRGTSLAPALDVATGTVRRHATVFVMSDFLTSGWEKALARCGRRHDTIAVRLLGPELELPRVGLLETRDPETGRTRLIDTNAKRVRRAWEKRVQDWRLQSERAFTKAGVDRMDVPIPAAATAEAVARPILRFFRMREQRGAKR